MRILLISLFISSSLFASAQKIFPIKIGNCTTEDGFCFDCGDVKGAYDSAAFVLFQKRLNTKLNLNGIEGTVKFQVLIDSNGHGCVLSHTDVYLSPLSSRLVNELNKFKQWTPAKTNGKKVPKTSITISVVINNRMLYAQVERIDIKDFMKGFDVPFNPKIINKKYVYKNYELKNYEISVLDTKNSNLGDNFGTRVSIDKDGLIWFSTLSKIFFFDGIEFKNLNQIFSPKDDDLKLNLIAVDHQNVKWMFSNKAIYSYHQNVWTKYDSSIIGNIDVEDIVINKYTDEVFFCTDNGLLIYNKGVWTNINMDNVPGLPSNNINFAKRDSKKRLWISTFSGSVVIDEHKSLFNSEALNIILKGRSIMALDESEKGSIFFSLYKYNNKPIDNLASDEGLIKFNPDSSVIQYNSENSGMPINYPNDLLYDVTEKVLWITTDKAGLVRYDLNDSWENYHNLNSFIPTSYLEQMAFDDKGRLYIASRQGLVKIERVRNK